MSLNLNEAFKTRLNIKTLVHFRLINKDLEYFQTEKISFRIGGNDNLILTATAINVYL